MKRLLLLLLVTFPVLLHAQGYQVNLMGQKQIGMGHTGVGLAQDGASIYFNPGGMALLDANYINLGVSPVILNSSFRAFGSSTTENTKNPVSFPYQAYGVWGPQGSRFKFGLGSYAPFGGSYHWKDDWTGSKSLISLQLQAIFIQPTVSFKISDKLGIGAGFVYTIGTVDLKQGLPAQSGSYSTTNQASTELKSTNGMGYGYNIGVYYKPTDKLSFGLTYHSYVDVKVKNGSVNFANIPTATANLFQPGTQFNAYLPLPGSLNFGVGYKATDKLTLAVDFNYLFWSVYDSLRIDFNKPVGNNTQNHQGRNYRDCYQVRIGAQYQVIDRLYLRAGGYYGYTPVKKGYVTPEDPDYNRVGVTGGLTYGISDKFAIDACFEFLDVFKTDNVSALPNGNSGTYKTFAFIPGVGVTYKF